MSFHLIAAAVMVFLTIIHIFAICLTVFRLYHRHSISRLWWDDYIAAVALVVDCGTIIDVWMGFLEGLRNLVIKYKIGFISLVIVEWTTRIALALAFARIFPPGEKTRTYAISMATLFFFLFIAILVQTICFCSNPSAWSTVSFIECNMHGELLYFIIVANLLADALLVCSPLYALRHLRLPTEQRRLIFTCFAGSALMSSACIATTVFQFVLVKWPERGYVRVVLGYVEGSVSLIVCNLMVIVTYVYKVYRQERPTETSNRTQETHRTSRPSPPYTGGYPTPITFTEISEAYFTDPASTFTRSDRTTSRITCN